MVTESGKSNENDTTNGNTLPAAVPFPVLSYTDIIFDPYSDSELDCSPNRRIGRLLSYSFTHAEQVDKSTADAERRKKASRNRRCTTRARSTPRAQTLERLERSTVDRRVLSCPGGLDGPRTPFLPFRISEHVVCGTESGGAGHLDAVAILDS